MANIGASNPYYAKYSESAGNITYSNGGVLGELVNINVEVQATENNDFRANNRVKETQRKFSSGTITLSPDDLRQKASKDILGIKEQALDTIAGVTDTEVKELVYDDDQQIPYLGIGFIQKKQRDNINYWRAVVLTKIMFVVPSDAATTEGETIEWQTPELSGSILRDDSAKHMWKREATFTTEAQADAYLRHFLNIPTSVNVNPDIVAP